MTKAAKAYIASVIAAGGLVLAVSLANWSSPDPRAWAIYLVLAVLASVVKLRLPGMDGTYSLGFLFVLYGVAHLGLCETLLAGCAGVVAGSLVNTKKGSSLVQVLFNIGNVAISAGTCFWLARVWLAPGMTRYLPAVIAVAACAYFLVNTVLVSGVLSLLQGKGLAEVCSQWYVWSFPYYLIGVALVGLLPSGGRVVSGEAWLVLLPLVYLVHFFLGLVEWHSSSPAVGERPDTPLPRAARIYVIGVVTAGVILTVAAVFRWESTDLARFISYLTLAVVASTLKIRLPLLRQTMSPAFVLLLLAVAASLLVIAAKLHRDIQVPGYTPIVLATMCFGALTSLGFGIVGQYLWLGLQISRRRPNYIVRSAEEHGAPDR